MRFYNMLLAFFEKLKQGLVWLCDIANRSPLLYVLTFIPIVAYIFFLSACAVLFSIVELIVDMFRFVSGDFNEPEKNN